MFTDRYFLPDLYLNDIYQITPDLLSKQGIRAVLLDIDNTLVTYDDPKPTQPVLAWFSTLKENGVSIALISNNNRRRVELFNEELKFFATWNSGKPSRRCYRAAMAALASDRTDTAVIGDQIFTDIWSARRLGLFSILVQPIQDKSSLFFRFKRALERPFLRRYRQLHPVPDGTQP